MTANRLSLSNSGPFRAQGVCRRRLWRLRLSAAVGLAWLACSLVASHGAAASVTWDATTSSGPADGSGNWLGGSTWWTGLSDQAWVQGSSAVLGAATPGAYSLSLNGAVAAAGVTFKTDNYTLSGSTLTYTNGMVLSNGATAAINCAISTPGQGITVGNNGSVLTLGGGWASTSGNPTWKGSSAATSTLNITNGTYTEGGTFLGDAITINQTGGVVSFSIWNMGRNVAGPAIWNLSGGQLKTPSALTANGISISRGQTALLNVSSSGLLSVIGNLGIASTTTTDNGTLNVSGGTANIGTNLNLLGVSSGAYAAAAKAALNISGGVTTARGIAFGNAAASYVNHPASTFTLSGGALCLGANGIVIIPGQVGAPTPIITLSGGLLAAAANWTGSAPMTLTNFPSDLTRSEEHTPDI